jgi:hypothetical protein
MATCIASLTVGFASCWPVALATLCTTPFILAAGIVSNLFLTRLAEHVQETYSEAALIAEQVLLSNHLPPLHRLFVILQKVIDCKSLKVL